MNIVESLTARRQLYERLAEKLDHASPPAALSERIQLYRAWRKPVGNYNTPMPDDWMGVL
jgi:hypothetical protein